MRGFEADQAGAKPAAKVIGEAEAEEVEEEDDDVEEVESVKVPVEKMAKMPKAPGRSSVGDGANTVESSLGTRRSKRRHDDV